MKGWHYYRMKYLGGLALLLARFHSWRLQRAMESFREEFERSVTWVLADSARRAQNHK